MNAQREHLLDIYNVHLHLATTKRELANLRRRYPKIDKTDEWGGATKFGRHPKDAPPELHVAIWINVAEHYGDQAQLLDTCAHEATHAACMILEASGVDYDSGSEPLCYLVGWLTRWVYGQAT